MSREFQLQKKSQSVPTLACKRLLQRRAANEHAQETVPPIVHEALRSPGQPLDVETRAFFEPRFGHEFSQVRVHTDSRAAQSARSVMAEAYTLGQDIVIDSSKFAPRSSEGERLLAHELAHTIQFGPGTELQVRRQTPKQAREIVQKKLEAWAKMKKIPPSLAPSSEDYANTLQDYAYETTHAETDLQPKPKKAPQIKKWAERFQDAYEVALMILEAKNASQREERAGMIAQDLALAGFIDEALDVAAKLTADEEIQAIFTNVLERPDAASANQLKTVALYLTKKCPALSDNPLIAKLTDHSGTYAKLLGTTKLLATLEPALDAFKGNPGFVDVLAKVLVFYRKFRAPFSEWLWTMDKDYLFRVLSSDYFVEPGYGGTEFPEAGELTMAKDMPWVYAYKQRYYIDYLIHLGAKHKIEVKAPSTHKFKAVRAWLEANTETIGQILMAEYPASPENVTKVYECMADIFFYHVERGNVTPHLGGKVSHLPPSAPAKMRLKADCDVLSTYASRLLKSAGFTPVGYMAIIPDQEDGHSVALLERDKVYYIVNNKQVTQIELKELQHAIVALRDDALDIYYKKPGSFRVYYDKAMPNGSMSKELHGLDESLRRKDLEP